MTIYVLTKKGTSIHTGDYKVHYDIHGVEISKDNKTVAYYKDYIGVFFDERPILVN